MSILINFFLSTLIGIPLIIVAFLHYREIITVVIICLILSFISSISKH